MTTARDRLRRAAATAGWLGLAAAPAVVLLSIAFSPESSGAARVAMAGFCVLAIARPPAAMLVAIALAGFGTILAHLLGAPHLRVTEALIVGALAGCGLRAVPPGAAFRQALAGSTSWPVVLLALTALASTAVWLRVHQVETLYPAPYLGSLVRFLVRDYFLQPGEFWLVVTTAVILQGLALYVAVAALCRMDPEFFGRALRMLVIGAAGLGVLSVVRLAEILLRSPQMIEVLRATSDGLRISPQIPDYIAAGSYFTLCWVVALGMAIASPRHWPLWVTAGVPMMAAFYLTGSRSVIAAALAGLAALVLVVARRRASSVKTILAFAGLAVVMMVASYPWLTGRDAVGVMARQSVTVRAELLWTGVRVVAERPLFGVGLERFHLMAGGLASPRLHELFPVRKNPHNDLLRFGAELGLVGLAFFVWILAAAGRRMWGTLRATADPRLAGLAGGLLAFLTTSMVSNPLMVREVSFVFWIALGLAVSQAARRQPAGLPARASRPRSGVMVLIAALLVASVPFRAQQEVATAVDLRHVSYGFFDWDADIDGTPFRWSGPRVTFYVDGRARVVEIPLSGALLPTGEQQVEIRIDGRLADRVIAGTGWQRVRTVLPADTADRTRRVDLRVLPSWVPAEIVPDNEDRRELGVRVGRIEVFLQPE